MNFILTNNSKKALQKIKEQMLNQFQNKDLKKYRLKFTKKKEFVAVLFPYLFPAFRLYLNGKLYKDYIFNNGNWEEF